MDMRPKPEGKDRQRRTARRDLKDPLEELLEELKRVRADEGFLRFLWERHFPTWTEDVIIPLADKKLRDSEARKTKRRLQRANPDGWGKEWKEHYLPWLKESRKEELHMRSGPSGSEIATLRPRDPKGPGRPRNDALWAFVWLARAYFKRLTGGPQWRLIAGILTEWGGYKYEYATLESDWVRSKAREDFMIPSRKQIAYLRSYVLPKLERYMRSPAGRDERESLEIGRQKILAQIAFLQERHEENLRWLKNNPTSMERHGIAVQWDPNAWLDSSLRCYQQIREWGAG